MRLSPEGVDAVRRFCETVSDRNIQNLELLRAIDKTVDWLSGLQNSTSGDVKFAHKFIDLIKASDFDSEIDPDNVLAGKLEQSENTIGRLTALLKRKQQSAIDDDDLIGDNKQCVADEYETTVTIYSELLEAVVELRSVIKQHDSELSDVVGPFDTVDELIASLEK